MPTRLTVAVCSAILLTACSAEEPSSSGDGGAPTAAAPAPHMAAAGPERTGLLRDPTPDQVAAVAADWLGRPIDHEAMAQEQVEYQRADAAERPAVLARLVGESRAAAAAATGVGVLDVSTPISGVSYDPAAEAYLLPVFSPGSAINLAPSHLLRLSNAEAAYSLGMGNAVAQSMRATQAQPTRVRLQARLEGVQPTANGAVLIGRLQSFTLYDAEGAAIGEVVSMSADAPAAS